VRKEYLAGGLTVEWNWGIATAVTVWERRIEVRAPKRAVT